MSETVNSSLKKAVKGSALIFLGSILGLFLWFASKLLLVRILTKEEFGIYSLAVTVSGILAALATLGLSEGATRYVSIYLGKNEAGKASATSQATIWMALPSGLLFMVALEFFSRTLVTHFFYMPALLTPIRITAVSGRPPSPLPTQ